MLCPGWAHGERGIGDLGFLSDCATAALVDRAGSVEWWCVPRFDSPSLFGRLLAADAGHWSLRPAADSTVRREYVEDTLVLRTVHRTADGEVAVTDALAFEAGARGHDVGLRSPRLLDVLGEVLDAAYLLRDGIEQFTPAVRDLLVALADRAADSWADPDAGMWEARDAARHYTSSKVMCWVALDRAVRLAPRLGDAADPDRWAAAREKVHAAVLEQAWSATAGAYAGAFGSDELDTSVLVLPLVGFLPMADPRMAATVEVIATRLGDRGLVRRWAADPSDFLICTYWLVECLAMAGQADRADALFRLATGHANDLGLLAEEADPDSGEALGNVPQAFSHVGPVNAAWRLAHPEDGPSGG